MLTKRGVVVAEAALATLLGSRVVEATPVGFASALGRLALAGTVGKGAPVATATGILGGSILMNKALIGVATIVITALIAWYCHEPTVHAA